MSDATDRHGPGVRVATLDGVRGVAVILVLAFHLGVPGAAGGWMGVDVFFVLSGYLITSLLVTEWRATGRVSLPQFWGRRARRLLPALLVMLPVVIAAALLLGRPAPTLRGDAYATLAYVANWRFIASDQSYFASFDVSPLRHAWSLAIEEQFYLVWPVAIVLLLRFVRRPALRVAGVVVLALLSAWWMRVVAGDGTDLSRAYYGSDTRLATILAGCVAALCVTGASERTRSRLRRLSGGLVVLPGVVLAVVAVGVPEDTRWLYTSGGFAGIAVLAALVVVGAAHLGTGGVHGVLASSLLVRAGLISYGLYLWHWPVIVLLDADRVDLPRPALIAVQLALAVALAELSFRLVEHPIRTRRLRVAHPLLVVGATVAAVALIAAVAVPGGTDAGTIPQASSGTVVAAPAAAGRVAPPPPTRPATTPVATTAPTLPPSPPASPTEPFADPTEPSTSTTPSIPTTTTPPVTVPAAPPDVLVLGDSLVWVVASNPPPDSQLAIRGVFHAKCDIVGDRIVAGGHVNEVDSECRRWPERWDAALRDDPPDAVIVIGGLRQLFDLDVDGQRLTVGSADWDRTYRRAVRRALGIIRHRVTAPVLWFDVPCYRWDAEGTDGEEHDQSRIDIVNAALRDELAADPRVTLLDYRSRVCDGDRSIESLRPDGAHLTVPATHDLWRWLEPMILRGLAEGAG